MQIHLFIPEMYKTIEDLNFSQMASIRLRAAIIANYSPQYGSTISFGEFIPETSNIIFVTKPHGHDIEKTKKLWFDQLKFAKEKKKVIFVDYTDHHLGYNSILKSFYEATFKLTDFIITSSDHLKLLINNYTCKKIYVIPDTFEVPILSPKISKTNQILWFGHGINMIYLIKFIENFPKTNEIFQINIVSNNNGLKFLSEYKFQNKIFFKLNLQKWSIESLIAASKKSDICIIPSDSRDPIKSGVSSNRIITSLALGLPTLAEMMPSYQEFSKYFFNIKSNSLFEIMSNSSSYKFKKLISEAQEKILPKFLPQTIAKKWFHLFKKF